MVEASLNTREAMSPSSPTAQEAMTGYNRSSQSHEGPIGPPVYTPCRCRRQREYGGRRLRKMMQNPSVQEGKKMRKLYERTTIKDPNTELQIHDHTGPGRKASDMAIKAASWALQVPTAYRPTENHGWSCRWLRRGTKIIMGADDNGIGIGSRNKSRRRGGQGLPKRHSSRTSDKIITMEKRFE